jgi:hypothetical protein
MASIPPSQSVSLVLTAYFLPSFLPAFFFLCLSHSQHCLRNVAVSHIVKKAWIRKVSKHVKANGDGMRTKVVSELRKQTV